MTMEILAPSLSDRDLEDLAKAVRLLEETEPGHG